MKNRIDKGKTQKIITVVSANYVELLVLDLLEKAFQVYRKRNFQDKHFQVSVLENTYATSAVVLTVLGIEAYRNRIFYLEKKKRVGRDVAEDLAKIIDKKTTKFPKGQFQAILDEIFVIRDVIVHNHIYKVTVFYDKDWGILGHRQRLLKGYGNVRFKNSVNQKTRKTKVLKLNVQPSKIGFEEVYTLLAVFDLLVGLLQRTFSYGHVPFKLMHKISGEWVDNLGKLLAYYYDQIPNVKYAKNFNNFVRSLKGDYSTYVAKHEIIAGVEELFFERTYVINNFCPKCGTFGFHKPQNKMTCPVCKFEIGAVKVREISP